MRIILAALAVLACLTGAAHAQDRSAAAGQVIAEARSASGGNAWNALRGLHLKGQEEGQAWEAWYDPIRWGARVETREPAGVRIRGFNGLGDWTRLPDGALTASDQHSALAQARTGAFFGAYGYYFPSRFAAHTAMLGTRTHQGRAHDVIRVEPMGGEPRELWFDARSHLLSRIVDATGAEPVDIELSDYRRVDGVMLPFKVATRQGGRTRVRELTHVDVEPADRTLFSWSPGEQPRGKP